MNIIKKIRLAGLLILVGMIAGIFSVAPAIDSTDYLTEASHNYNQVIIAAIFQFILSLSYIGFAVLIYPIVKKLSNSLSIGFLSFRILAVSVSVIGTVLLLSTLALSELYVQNSSEGTSIFSTLGIVLKSTRDTINHIFMVLLLCSGNIILYILFFKTKLMPRWIALWGIWSAILSIFASGLILFKVVDIITPEYLIINVPTALFELFFGGWLIIKGFNRNIFTQHL